MRLAALVRWFEIGMRMAANPFWFWRTMFPAASSHQRFEEV